MKYALVFFGASILLLFSCERKKGSEITKEEMITHLEYLASDDLAGRYPGSREDSTLLAYISNQFRSFGLKKFGESYLQDFNFLSGIKPSDNNSLAFDRVDFNQQEDYYPLS